MKKNSNIVWGIIILLIGIIFLGNNFDFWNINIFFDGWWTLFIIIPSFYALFKKEWLSSILGIFIGLLLLLACQDLIQWHVVGKAFLPIILIVVGISLICKPKSNLTKNNTKNTNTKNSSDSYIGVFSSNENKVSTNFDGTSIVAIFGGVELDLRDAKIDKDVVIDVVSIFGGADIFLPDNVSVKISGIPLFGGVENKHKDKKGSTVYINYTAIFGGIDLK